ncbi:globin domain-containing protein [Microbacterium sp. p3-SID337]|nr:globin domain-containing protein [Microbacterium sp. p3-SID131]MCT1377888.1 globin domain-containing protein [Microbacterium sp. p3-SID337]
MQLSTDSEAIVRATAGVVASHADEITTLFYRRMFEAHPELLNVFNRAHQAQGDQPKALAASVVAFAVHLIDPDAPDFSPVMRRIAHRHVSLGVSARQYAIVGRYLLAAVDEVLGEAVTPAVHAAWDEVYWLFGCSLIAEEARLYAEAGTDPDHPWRPHRVIERVEEARDVISLVLEPVDGQRAPHRTGQYVAVAVDLPDGTRQPRQYTISSSAPGAALRVTVKRVRGVDGAPDGQVSTWLHENAQVGTVLDVSQPAGDLLLDDSDDALVLISAGIGITPVAAMVDDLAQRRPDRPVHLFHVDREPDTHALVSAVRGRAQHLSDVRALTWYTAGVEEGPSVRSGRMDLAGIDLPPTARVFLCGPLSFMQAVRGALTARGIEPDRIDYEVFGPDLWARRPESGAA